MLFVNLIQEDIDSVSNCCEKFKLTINTDTTHVLCATLTG